jgi:lysophospholipase L1-like esterase
VLLAWLTLTAALGAACGGSSSGPSPLPFSLACPSRVDGATTDGAGVAVQFQVTAQGGRPPATVTCTPASGSTFPIGPTTVSCTATDAAAQTAECSFPVNVTRIPTLAWTRFLASGDSITEGVTSQAPSVLRRLGLPDAYPGQLEPMLAARYSAQTITVVNRGVAGERLAQGVDRLPGVLDEERPEVLLLLEGVNNIRNVPTQELAGDLDEMVRAARRRNVQVLLATLLPISDEYEAGHPGTQQAIEDLNEEIVDIARKNRIGAPVDLFFVFSGAPSLIGVDGLHPTPAGYMRMAEVFFDAIRDRYEVQPPAESIVVGVQSPASFERAASRTAGFPLPPAAGPSRSYADAKKRGSSPPPPQR